jgi:hypothetical protein
MAKILVTVDYMDGRSTVRGPLYADEINTHGMLFRLSERGIATITFTNAEPLSELIRQSEEKSRG